jgi:hypothetical protein
LNKLSTQKQKHLRNNGFSQAVVPNKKPYKAKKIKRKIHEQPYSQRAVFLCLHSYFALY